MADTTLAQDLTGLISPAIQAAGAIYGNTQAQGANTAALNAQVGAANQGNALLQSAYGNAAQGYAPYLQAGQQGLAGYSPYMAAGQQGLAGYSPYMEAGRQGLAGYQPYMQAGQSALAGYQPYMQAGQAGLAGVQNQANIAAKPYSYQDFQNSGDYQSMMAAAKQQQDGLRAQNAGAGMYGSGNMANALQTNAQQNAAQYFNQGRQGNLAGINAASNMYGNLANMGQSAMTNLTGVGANAASGLAGMGANATNNMAGLGATVTNNMAGMGYNSAANLGNLGYQTALGQGLNLGNIGGYQAQAAQNGAVTNSGTATQIGNALTQGVGAATKFFAPSANPSSDEIAAMQQQGLTYDAAAGGYTYINPTDVGPMMYNVGTAATDAASGLAASGMYTGAGSDAMSSLYSTFW